MRVAVFTGNQPRHVALINRLAEQHDVFAVQECTTAFPGEVEDFYRKSPVMQEYFNHVLAAEREVFGGLAFTAPRAQTLAIKMGDLNKVPLSVLEPALETDFQVVFGASWIKGPLIDALVQRGAVNIHMGVSPYYRGACTNFWAMYDRSPGMVGATIHYLTKGLDSGPIICHALPFPGGGYEPFFLGMWAVWAAHEAVMNHLNGQRPVFLSLQDPSKGRRYSRTADFTDAVAEEYLRRLPSPAEIKTALDARNPADYVRPFFA